MHTREFVILVILGCVAVFVIAWAVGALIAG